MHRDNHYEAAFEAFLRARRLPYIAVDEARRSLVADGSLKSLDFIVSPPGQSSWLVDVKGRRFPSGDEHHQYWKNWSTRDDLRSLAAWQNAFRRRLLPAAGVRLPPRRPALAAAARADCSSSAATTTASWASGWPIMCRTPGRFPIAGTRSPCPPACSAAWPGRSTTGSPARCSPCPSRPPIGRSLPADLEWEA